MTDYTKRLQIPIEGNTNIIFTTKSGTIIAIGYQRIVIGGRGPYIEFSELNISIEFFKIPESEEKRIKDSNGKFYYWEYRTDDESNVKMYYQRKIVDYADYKIGMYYISPFDLLADGKIIIEKLKRAKNG